MQITSQEQFRRTVQALAETDALLAQERGHLPHLQKADRIVWLEQHANKLGSMIREYRVAN